MYRNATKGGPSHGHVGHAQQLTKIGPAVPEICSHTDIKTHRQIDRNTPLPYMGEVTRVPASAGVKAGMSALSGGR